uniref:Uncharacterized protein n=1 Tax=Salix viminalis TaxID=40686 RepID=A0A6N2KV85_SALVM
MKSFLAVLVLFSFLSFVELSDARKEPREYYWKSMMKDEPMPEAIKELFVEDPAGAGEMNHFVKDFDTRHSAIIYHSHAEKDRLKERKIYECSGSRRRRTISAGFQHSPSSWSVNVYHAQLVNCTVKHSS